jgi:alpha-L-fucosidase
MLLKKNLLAACLITGLSIGTNAQNTLPIVKGLYNPNDSSTFRQYKCPDWFRDAKFGIWSHWGPQAVPRHGDWYAKKLYQQGSGNNKYHVKTYGHPSKFGYKDIIPLWKAEKRLT